MAKENALINICPCGSNKNYQDCCEIIHNDHSKCDKPETLMRARYSAFVKNKVEFIDQTNIPGTKDFDINDAKVWATQSTWDHLEVINTSENTVEFKAFYADDKGNNHIHHEVGHFKKQDDLWYYTEGQIVGTGPITRTSPKVGRNDPCICGSGKKFKKCCGKN